MRRTIVGEGVDSATVFAAGDDAVGRGYKEGIPRAVGDCGSGAACGDDGDAEGVAGIGAEPPSQGGKVALVGTPSGIMPHNSLLALL